MNATELVELIYKQTDRVSNTTYVIIDKDGRKLKLQSGKSSWNKPGHAKAALRVHVQNSIPYMYKIGNHAITADHVVDTLLTTGQFSIIKYEY